MFRVVRYGVALMYFVLHTTKYKVVVVPCRLTVLYRDIVDAMSSPCVHYVLRTNHRPRAINSDVWQGGREGGRGGEGNA